MEYRFSWTPRLVALGACSLVLLVALFFSMGYVIGHRLAEAPGPGRGVKSAVPEPDPAGEAPEAPPAPVATAISAPAPKR